MLRSLRDVLTHWELVRMFVMRDLIVRYRGSMLGILWSLATPLIQMVVLTIVFRSFFSIPEPNYSFKVLSALLAWNFFRDTTLNACSSILDARELIKKVYFPREVIPISIVLGNAVHFVIALVMMLLLFAFRPVALTPTYLFIPVLILVQTLLLLGIAMAVACAHTFYHDVKYLIDAGMQVFFYLTPIFYMADYAEAGIPKMLARFAPGHENLAPYLYHLYMLNPMATLGTAYRSVMLENTLPDPSFFLPVAALAVVAFLLGYRSFVRHSWQFPEIL